MTNRERFARTMNFEPVDRLPTIEWAAWWNLTVDRWHNEGLPAELTGAGEIREYLGLDPHEQLWISPRAATCPGPAGHGLPIVRDREEYHAIKPHLYPDPAFDPEMIRQWAARQSTGEMLVYITLEGFFWYPRTLLGIEPHLYAFYDQPDLMKEINEDLLAFNLRVIDQFCEVCVPDFMTLAEDMSYNHGPMISAKLFDEFVHPCTEALVRKLREKGIVVIVDTDGDVTAAVSWYKSAGVQGFLPLERMAGVDVNQIRAEHPELLMIGAFDKTVMHRGEARIREEFERIGPVMRQGGYIPSVDHQTPPEVSLDQYRQYLELLREYCERYAPGGSE